MGRFGFLILCDMIIGFVIALVFSVIIGILWAGGAAATAAVLLSKRYRYRAGFYLGTLGFLLISLLVYSWR